MRKQIVLIVITVALVITAGVFYSFNYYKNNKNVEMDLGYNNVISDELESKNRNSYSNQSEVKQEELLEIKENQDFIDNHMIYVHICGAVHNEGVYSVADGTRLVELIKLAGGLRKDAAGNFINQALIVEDAQKIYIPTIEEVDSMNMGESILDNSFIIDESNKDQSIVNINTASISELMNLPGIGEAKAKKIIDYREKNGKFKEIEELKKISGIKDGVFDKISSYVVVK